MAHCLGWWRWRSYNRPSKFLFLLSLNLLRLFLPELASAFFSIVTDSSISICHVVVPGRTTTRRLAASPAWYGGFFLDSVARLFGWIRTFVAYRIGWLSFSDQRRLGTRRKRRETRRKSRCWTTSVRPLVFFFFFYGRVFWALTCCGGDYLTEKRCRQQYPYLDQVFESVCITDMRCVSPCQHKLLTLFFEQTSFFFFFFFFCVSIRFRFLLSLPLLLVALLCSVFSRYFYLQNTANIFIEILCISLIDITIGADCRTTRLSMFQVSTCFCFFPYASVGNLFFKC